MALPIGHGFVGIAIGKKTNVKPLTAFLLATFADIDYFFGLFFAGGNMLAFHRSSLTHSPFFGIFVALFFWLLGGMRKERYSLRQLIGIWLIVTSHWAIDFILLPYRFDITAGRNGLVDFVFAHLLNAEMLHNIFIDLAVYGTLYVILVKLIWREKKP